MPYHVYIWEQEGGRRGRGENFYFVNLNEEQLKTRVLDAWSEGGAITWEGRTVEVSTIDVIRIYSTDEPVEESLGGSERYSRMQQGRDETNELIAAPPGGRRDRADNAGAGGEATSPLRDRRRVMVVYGRNLVARDAIFTFLRALGLRPIEWEQAVAETGLASPHNLDAVRAAMAIGQAVVVILTAEDRAALLPALADGDDDELLRGQPRQNVILEAGLAMGVDPARTILVELGSIRRPSDFEGLNVVRLTNAPATRQALRTRLQNAGCDIDESASDWIRPEAGGDFETCALPWEPESVD